MNDFMTHSDGGGGFSISRRCGPVRHLCNRPLLSRTLKASRAMEPEHDNVGYVFLFASPSQSGRYVLNSWASSGLRGNHSRHATLENRISVHATKTITDAEANFEEAWKREVQMYHKEVKQRVRRLDIAIIYVSGTRFAFGGYLIHY